MIFPSFLILVAWGIAQIASAEDMSYSGEVYINEYLPNPAGNDSEFEFIELYNAPSDAIEVSGWVLDNGGSGDFTIPDTTIISGGGYAVFYSTQTGSLLANTGDRQVRLLDPLGMVHTQTFYSGSKEAYSYNRTDDGSYLQSPMLTPNAANEFPLTPTPEPTLTPTAIPQVYSLDIHINEFLPNPKGDDALGEFIELVNTGSEPVDISEWVLDDVEDAGSAPYSIPDKTILPANGFVALYRPHTKISLNNDSDHVRLIRPDAVVQDDVSYTDTKEAHSYNRTDAEKYEKSSTITPGAANIITNISTPTPKQEEEKDTEKESKATYDFSTKILINEFLPNPEGEDSELEFIEIKSFEKRNIKLFGYLIDDGEGGSAPYNFKKEDSIEAGKILVLFRSKTKIALNNDKDSVRLLDPNRKAISIVAYEEKIIEGQSYNKNADGEFEWSEILTPGKENTISIQEKFTPTPKSKASKKVSVPKLNSSSRVLSAAIAASTLPWPEQVQPEGFVSRSVLSLGGSAQALMYRQVVFVFFGMSLAGMQLISGIRHKEKIWQKW